MCEFETEVFFTFWQVHPSLAISSKAMSITNSVVSDTLERLASEAAQPLGHHRLPAELAKHAVSEGTKALTKYTSSKHPVKPAHTWLPLLQELLFGLPQLKKQNLINKIITAANKKYIECRSYL